MLDLILFAIVGLVMSCCVIVCLALTAFNLKMYSEILKVKELTRK